MPHEIPLDREESPVNKEKDEQEKELLQQAHPSADTEATWIKKAGKIRYGYKKYVVTDEQGLVLGITTTPKYQ